MTVQTLRPNGTQYMSGFTNTGGAATIQGALSDDLDATYIRRTSTTAFSSGIIRFGTYTIDSDEKVRRVRLRARCKTDESTSRIAFAIRTTFNGIIYYAVPYQRKGIKALSTYEGPWLSVPPGGGAWTQEKIDAIEMGVSDYATTGAARGYVYELFIDVDVKTAPTVSVTSPSGTITTTSKPSVAWTYTDLDGDQQAYYEIKVFNDTQYTDPEFDVTTSEPFWTSGEVTSINETAQITAFLPNDDYRAYMRVGKDLDGTPFWSQWAYSAFTMNVSAPAAPTITLSHVSASGYVAVTADNTGAPTFDYQEFEIQRSTDQLTWTTIRDGDMVRPDTDGTYAAKDYEAKRGVTNYWRARAIGTLGSDVYVSAWGATANVSVTNDGTWWLKPLTTPTLSRGSLRIAPGFQTALTEATGVFLPIGRTTPFVVSSGLTGRTGQYEINAVGDTEWTDLNAIISHKGDLLVEDPTGASIYVRLVSRQWVTAGRSVNPIRQVNVQWVEATG